MSRGQSQGRSKSWSRIARRSIIIGMGMAHPPSPVGTDAPAQQLSALLEEGDAGQSPRGPRGLEELEGALLGERAHALVVDDLAEKPLEHRVDRLAEPQRAARGFALEAIDVAELESERALLELLEP